MGDMTAADPARVTATEEAATKEYDVPMAAKEEEVDALTASIENNLTETVENSRDALQPRQLKPRLRPLGILRYAPGGDGNDAMVMAITPKSRYPGDSQRQAFAADIQSGWTVKSATGEEVAG